MALGNFSIQEILYGVAEDIDGKNILYTLDQLSSASIEVTSDPTEITDKNGNVIRQIYKSKSATFTATSALLSPVLLNAQSGSEMETASSSKTIVMPKVMTAGATEKIDLTTLGIVVPTSGNPDVEVIEIAANGANADKYASSDLISKSALVQNSTSNDWELDLSKLTTASQNNYFLVKFDRTVSSGYKITNKANQFPSTISLTLYAAVVDPCEDQPRAAYITIPSFQPDPSVTINLDSENTETDFTGSIQVNFCDCGKELYTIYFPDEEAVVTAQCE